MGKNFLLIFQYLVSSEESRIGRTDYWDTVFLAGKSPFNKTCLEIFKVLFLITLSFSILMVLARF